MSTFDVRNDAPGMLRSEALTINIKFERTGPSTGRVSWNIPTPAAGCTADDQAYCGMLVTLDTTAAGLAKAPTNGRIYSSDATADINLFAGDKIDTALVIGAFYQDRTTVFFDVSGLKANTPYFVSGYPVDCQFRYFTSGVHAYSQSLTSSNATASTTGTQVVALAGNSAPTTSVVGAFGGILQDPPTVPDGVEATDITGLVCGAFYDFQCQIGVLPDPRTPVVAGQCIPQLQIYTVSIDGCFSSTYADLVDEINKQFSLLVPIGSPPTPQGPFPPNTNGLWWNASTQQLFQWNGFEHIELPVIVQGTDPTIIAIGAYWYNPDTDELKIWNGATWDLVVVITHSTDPMAPVCDQTYWFDGALGYLWNGTTWCELTTFTDINDPSIQQPAPCGSFWYDSDDFILYRWNDSLNVWSITTAIQYHEDPNALPAGTYWFDETNLELNTRDIPSPGWNVETNVAVSETAPTTPAPGKYWYNPATQELFQWDGTMFVQLDVLSFPVDPTLRESCDLWWDTSETSGDATISFTAGPPVTPATSPGIGGGGTSYDFTLTVDGAAPVDYTISVVAADTMTIIAAKMLAAVNAVVNIVSIVAIGTGFVITSNTAGTTSTVIVTEPTTGANLDLFSWIDIGLTATHITVSTPGTDLADVLNVWDSVNSEWDIVTTFFQQDTDPTLPPTLVDGDLWFNPTDSKLYVWQNNCFILVEYIDWPTDPTLTIPNGTVWYDGTTWSVKTAGVWVPLVPTAGYADALVTGAPAGTVVPALAPSTYDVDVTFDTGGLQLISIVTAGGEDYNAIAALINAALASGTGTCTFVNGAFHFTSATLGFLSTALVAAGTAGSAGGDLFAAIPAGVTFPAPVSGVDAPIITTQDPTMLAIGSYWFNTSNDALQVWNGVMWVMVGYSTSPFTPTQGTLWFNTMTNTLMVWNGSTWVVAVPLATVELDCNGNLTFTDTSLGSLSFIAIGDISLFQTLLVPFNIYSSQPGTDGVSAESSYNEIGVGDDGTNDERFKLMNEVRYELGYPVVDVELTQNQLDFCVSRAIEELRGKSGICYRHGFFFMRVNAETQRYLLTNRVQGMHKIVNIQGVFRLTSAFLSSAHGAGVYGQIVLQHLYNMGTFDLLSYHIISEYVELMEILFAGRIAYTWDEHSRELWMHHRFPFNENMVLIEASSERAEQEIITDRWTRSWIRRFAAATGREILAEIRGKYSTLPGAGGAVTLNASDLRATAAEMKVKLYQEIFDYEADKPEDYGLGTQLVIG